MARPNRQARGGGGGGGGGGLWGIQILIYIQLQTL